MDFTLYIIERNLKLNVLSNTDELNIVVVTDGSKKHPILEVRQHNIAIKVGTFISEDHAKIFVDALTTIFNSKDGKRIL